MNCAELTIADVHEAFASGQMSSELLTASLLAWIDRLHRQEPKLNCLREVNPQALAQAAAADRKRREGGDHGPLLGVPLVLKDNMGTKDAMKTTAGVHAIAELRTPFDATVVSRLRTAGAIVLAKASCPDFCDYMASTMPSSHSTTGGSISHPYGLCYGRGGGSSTGVAAAVASGMALAGLGSETQNSIQAPASNTSLVGIKPTVGLVSRAGILPLAITQDTAGPIAKSVRDAAILLSAIAGPDLADSITLSALGAVRPDYSRYCIDSALEGARIGVPRTGFFGHEGKDAVDALVNKAIAAMHEAGAVIVDPAEIATASAVLPIASRVFRTDFKVGLNAFLARCGSGSSMRTMRDIVLHNERVGPEAIPYGQDLLLAAEATAGDWSEREYHADRARDLRLCRQEGIDRTLIQFHLDALVVPMDHAAKLTGKAGYPAVSVPCGYTPEGAPVGLTFIGAAWSEPRLIGIAHAFETISGARRPPALG